MTNPVQTTIYVSLFAQLFATIYSLFGLQKSLTSVHTILHDILGMETIVQIIEIIFYVTFGFIVPTLSATTDIAVYRYADWFITTPLMLLSTCLFMEYIEKRDEQEATPITIQTFLQKHKYTLILLFLANAMMLIMGYLQETNVVSIYISTFIGFASLWFVYYTIQNTFIKKKNINTPLWWYMFSTWSMYGVAAMFPNMTKNTIYNLLDIVSKNFYSVFLTTFMIRYV